MDHEILVHADLADLGRSTLARLAGRTVALSGGSTYEALFPLWRGPEARRAYLPVDERRVGLSHPGSNWRKAIERLLDPNDLPEQARHWALTAPGLEALVRDLCGAPEGTPSIDQIWLGMGDDGHTASLFPSGPELEDTVSTTLETTAPKAPHPRVTLGLSTLRAAANLQVVITGEAKGAVLRRVLDGDRSLPLTRVLEARPATLHLDAACAHEAGIG